MPQQLSLDLESVTPPRKELRELWTPDDIFKALLKDGPAILAHFSEDNRIEWKSARYQARELNDYFSMWANTQPYGGLIVVGVEKDGAQSGCHCVGTQKLSELESAGSDYCPDAQFESRRIQFRRADGENDFLLAIRVFYRQRSSSRRRGVKPSYALATRNGALQRTRNARSKSPRAKSHTKRNQSH